MVLSLIILLLLLGIAYFHYAQGFFSATMSAFCAVSAAVLAVGYHEVAVNSLLQGAVADYADALMLCGIFAVVYIVMRLIVDKLVPGNVRLPVMVDRVGGAVMGIIAAIFTTGIIALAAQTMPFGPSIGGYARYAVQDRPELNLPPNQYSRGSARTGDIHDQMEDDTFTPDKKKHLWIPVDEMLLNFVSAMSNGGSLAGDVSFASIHPDYPDELFGQRLGIQVGAKHTALNLPGKTPHVTVPEKGVFRVDTDFSKSSYDAEIMQLHERPLTYKKTADLQLVVRVIFNKDAADAGQGFVRISPGSVRLVADGQDFWPIGTIDNGRTLFLNKIDDFLFIDVSKADAGADFLFDIDDPTKVIVGGPKDPNQKVKDGVFIEVKRLARIDLSGREVNVGLTPSKDVNVMRKETVGPKKEKEQPGQSAAAASTDFAFTQATVSNKLFSPINTGVSDKDVKDGQAAQGSGTFTKTNGQLSALNIQPVASLTILAQGSNAVDDLYVSGNQKMVQIQGAPPAEGGDPWAWGALSKWQLIDTNGKIYSPAGGWAKVSKENADRMVAVYNAVDHPVDITTSEGRPMDVYIAFLVPSGTQLKQVKFNNKNVKDDLGTTAQ